MGTAADREFYVDAVLPALATRLDAAFPEFGWRQDARGWVATNEEMTHRVLGVRADRVVAHGPTPSGFLVHGGFESHRRPFSPMDGVAQRGSGSAK